jgi:hypothetical protein
MKATENVRSVGLEPTRRKAQALNLLCIPIPPRPRTMTNYSPNKYVVNALHRVFNAAIQPNPISWYAQ